MSNALEIELHQCHEYIRHVFTLYVGWFTFFLGIVLAAIGWSLHASIDDQGNFVTPYLFFGVVCFFEIQIALGLVGTKSIRDDMKETDQRAAALLKDLHTLMPVALSQPHTPQSPVPKGMHRTLKVMNWALWANAVSWPAVAIGVAVATYHFHIPIAAPPTSG